MIVLRRFILKSFAALSLASVIGCAEGVDPESSKASSTSTGGLPSTGGFMGTGLATANGGAVHSNGGSTPGQGGSTGGVTGTSGAGGSNPGTGGATSTGGQASVDAGPPAVGVLVAQYKVPGGSDPKDENLVVHFNLENRSSRTIPLSVLTMRYWYTIDGSAPGSTDYQELHINYADIGRISGGNTNAVLSFGKMTKPETGADHYIQVAFQGPYELAPGGATNQVEVRANWKNYSQKYDETNDYSWDATRTSFVDWRKITVYQSGVLVWGTEPDGTTPKAPGDGGTDGGPPGDGGSDGAAPPADAGRG